ncbi:MAG TPA: LuxR C-terminal-related transcriptional regulator [Pseudonocardia sp.]|uniref:LuxR C-terminal-related transcriptional regulator n=1 Tax=Pseudonocardia sp. TaxID=60912 RepID=UPI002C457EC9|nr:LuxR C-terminal-related transcriptional regulator [Pseudonocardia sp.]HTF48700.1 LuxR C-terminal-related transcriptional regulator [Pseudonocardia sp.]
MPCVPHAKISTPVLPAEFVERPALRTRLDEAAGLVLVCAPAGYGKTLLLSDWARSSTSVDTAWVTLDRDDNDPRRLWTSVVASAASCPSVPPSSRLHAPWNWRPGAQPEFLAELLEALLALPRPIRLVLDDLHELLDPQTLHGVDILVRNRPAGVQLVLSSRFDPPLALSRLRLAGRMWELRADRMSFTAPEAAALLANSGISLTTAQVEMLHQRTGGWAAGLRLAADALAEAADSDGFLARFSGDERSVADYLVGEILSRMPADTVEFLRVISISDPVPATLAAELSGRQDAGSLLARLEHETSLVRATDWHRDAYRVQELLRTYLLADLRRQGPNRAAALYAAAAGWWAGQERPLPALELGAFGHERALLPDLLHRFAVPLLLTGDHAPLRRALATIGAPATATDPWLALISALINLEAGQLPAALGDLRHARQCWPAQHTPDLAVLRAAAEHLGAVVSGQPPPRSARAPDITELPSAPALEALARLSRGIAELFGRGDRAAGHTELQAALELARLHSFDYLAMQCLVLLGLVAAIDGDLRAMRIRGQQALATGSEHGWNDSTWSAAATTMLTYAALLRAEPADAERLAADALGQVRQASLPILRFGLRTVRGAAAFDRGDRAHGLAELQQARSELGDLAAQPQLIAVAAMLEFRAALLLGHSTAARTVQSWFADRTGQSAEGIVMRAWTDAATGRYEQARALLRPVLDATASPLLSHTLVEAWLLETTLALVAVERPAARRALQTALAIAEPLDVLRPFVQAGQPVRELLVHHHGSLGSLESFADCALAAGGHHEGRSVLSERELTVLSLLPSLLSLDEIAADLTVSVNTVKSHVRSIYTKLGVSSRRTAVLTAHENGLLTNGARGN